MIVLHIYIKPDGVLVESTKTIDITTNGYTLIGTRQLMNYNPAKVVKKVD